MTTEKHMHSEWKIALVAAVLGGSILATALPARADNVTVGVGPGGIAFGYNDGYWDRDRHWHAWRNHEEAEHWRAENRSHYYDWKHDRDRDAGWRDNDRWWDHH
jgi:hypothetical protein